MFIEAKDGGGGGFACNCFNIYTVISLLVTAVLHCCLIVAMIVVVQGT